MGMETLAGKIAKWRTALAQADTGPLVVACEIRDLAEVWDDDLKREAGGLGLSAYLRKMLGKGKTLRYFMRRAHAVDKLGESIRRVMHHETAVYCVGQVPEKYWEPVKFMLRREQKMNGGNPLTKSMAVRRIRRIVGKTETTRAVGCQRCATLEARIRELEK